jgi:cytochrome c553
MNLSKNYIVKCSACHDDYANGVVGPSLLHKSAEDIANKIKAYKNLTQANVLMKYLVSQMDDAEINALAQEIANLNKEIMEAKHE